MGHSLEDARMLFMALWLDMRNSWSKENVTRNRDYDDESVKMIV